MKLGIKNVLAVAVLAGASLSAQAAVWSSDLNGENTIFDNSVEPGAINYNGTTVDLNFDLNFYGTSYDWINVIDNGGVRFVKQQMGSCADMQGTSLANNGISAFVTSDCAPGMYTDGLYDTYITSTDDQIKVVWNSQLPDVNGGDNLVNNFQLTLTDMSGVTGTNGDFNAEFRYNTIEWVSTPSTYFIQKFIAIAGVTKNSAFADLSILGDTPPTPASVDDPVYFPNLDDIDAGYLLDITEYSYNSLEDGVYILPFRNGVPVYTAAQEGYDVLVFTDEAQDYFDNLNDLNDGVYVGSEGSGTSDNPFMPVTINEDGDVVDGNNQVVTFDFLFEVLDGEVVYIDPEVAIGYDYIVTDSSSPLVASVILPTGFGDDEYAIYVWDGSEYVFVSELTAGDEYFFADAVDNFRVMGIETDANVDPADPLAFITGLTFNSSGTVYMSQTPVVFNTDASAVPLPGTLVLMGLGLFAMGAYRRCAA
ncbi:PEP-CTERM sorting domain-containing protein [Neptunomonas phycophila]|uniref:PEP-CTERM sorting domain-containing protein n=1 Tax=Neptunomonas phycophila TaxID=1572645 RepID=UPI001BE55B7F|nr:PEP-CTERM sorting domain-containing protein [Neptunomonas phycophila]MBT3144860.1 PEP-CTERM sorting domain-containing protein [Neptunomonas phycophila]